MIEVTHAEVSFAVGGGAVDGGPDQAVRALAGVSCRVEPGTIVSVIGANGSGKSTLANLMCGALVARPGMVSVDGVDPALDEDARRHVRRAVGHVFQNPADQIVSTVVYDEIAFGPRNLGWGEERVAHAVADALAAVGLAGFEGREVQALSGGEQQRLAIAAVLAMGPAYVVLDEVTSQLDSAARPAFRTLFRALARERGTGVVQITHDPIEVLMGDRVLVMDGGVAIWEGTPEELLRDEPALMRSTLPPSRYAEALSVAVEHGYPLSRGDEPEDVASWLSRASQGLEKSSPDELLGEMAHALGMTEAEGPSSPARGEAPLACDAPEWHPSRAVEAHRVSFSYPDPRGGAPHKVLEGVDLVAPPGAITLIAGATGSGKSTFVSLVAGLEEPDEGVVSVGGRAPRPGDVAVSFQHPERQLFLDTVEAELAFAPRNQGAGEGEVSRRVEEARVRAGIAPALMARDPFALSGGQARRVAVAGVLTLGADALVLDEPTSGLDARGRRDVHELVRSLARDGAPVIVVSHDLEEWLDIAGRVALFAAGTVVWQGGVDELRADRDAFARAGLVAPEAWRLGAELTRLKRPAEGSCPDAAPRTPTSSPEDDRPAAARGGALAGVDARVKIALLLALTAALFASANPAVLAVWAVAIGCALALGGVGPRRVAHALRPLAILFAIVVCVNLISLDGTADIMLAAPLGLSLTGAERALTAMARILLLVGAALGVSETTTPTALADACVRLMRPLKRLSVPVGAVGLVLSLALRFIPLAMEEVARVSSAQRSRGVRFDEGGALARVRLWGAVLVPAVVSLFRHADRVAASMDARCYEEATAGALPPRPLAVHDTLALVAGLAAMAAITVAGRMIGA